MLNSKVLYAIIVLLTVFNLSVHAEVVEMHIPLIEDSPEQHFFFHDLLSKALLEAGYTPKLVIDVLPQLRAKAYLDLGYISIYWMIETAERNQTYIPIEVDLTNKLIGKRILFIKKGDQARYDQVKTLEDFRKLNLIAGMGKDWFDSTVWAANALQYKEEDRTWKSIFKKIPLGRDYDYFPRGINEILVESKIYPKLDIEQRLVLIYERDFRFYLSKTGLNAGARYKAVLDAAMKKALQSGLIERLVRRYWANDFENLHYDERIKIHLHLPK